MTLQNIGKRVLGYLSFPIILVTFLGSWMGFMYVVTHIVKLLGHELPKEDGWQMYSIMGGSFVFALVATYVVANALQGDFGRVASVGLGFGMLAWALMALVVIALVIWGATTFIGGTPAWALVIIVLLVLLLLKK